MAAIDSDICMGTGRCARAAAHDLRLSKVYQGGSDDTQKYCRGVRGSGLFAGHFRDRARTTATRHRQRLDGRRVAGCDG